MSTRIFCPVCSWAPSPNDRWQCRPGCLTVWNTFETHACCPGCHKRWQLTFCLACGIGSLHEDWYHDDEADTSRESDVAEVEQALVCP